MRAGVGAGAGVGVGAAESGSGSGSGWDRVGPGAAAGAGGTGSGSGSGWDRERVHPVRDVVQAMSLRTRNARDVGGAMGSAALRRGARFLVPFADDDLPRRVDAPVRVNVRGVV